MDGVQVGGDLTMVGGESQAVELERARIGGVFNLRGSRSGADSTAMLAKSGPF